MGNATYNEFILTRTAYCTLALGFCISLYSAQKVIVPFNVI